MQKASYLFVCLGTSFAKRSRVRCDGRRESDKEGLARCYPLRQCELAMIRSPSTRPLIVSLSCVILVGATSCSRREEATQPPLPKQDKPVSADICTLLAPEELQRILGERPERMEKSEKTGGGFTVSQCIVHMSTNTNSIAVSVTRQSGRPTGRDPRTFLNEKIEEREKGEGGEGEKPLDFVPGLGDKSIWMGTAVGGTLYVLKDHFYVRIALGTSKEPTKRKDKAIEIARLLVNQL